MLTKYTYKKLIWIDLESPTNDEVKELMQDYDIHPTVAEELLSPTLKSRLDTHDNYLYIILHFPTLLHSDSNEVNQEVDFIVGTNFLITVRYDSVDPLRQFAQELEMDNILDKSIASKHAGFMFYYMLCKLYHAVSEELDYLEGKLERIENYIFRGEEKRMVEALSVVSRSLLDIKHTVEQHEGILHSLQTAAEPIFKTKKFIQTLGGIMGEYRQAIRRIENLREYLSELRSTNDSLLSTKQNEVMKTLTIMAFVTFPLSLVATIFGMNTLNTPIIGVVGDFWIIIGLMVILTILFFWYFKYKKWL